MKLAALHSAEKALSLKPFFKGEEGSVISIQVKENEEMKDHITKVPALLVCVSGEILYSEHTGKTVNLKADEYVEIPAMISHRFKGLASSSLLLIK